MMDLGGYRQALQIWAEQLWGDDAEVWSSGGQLYLRVTEHHFWSGPRVFSAYREAGWNMPCPVSLSEELVVRSHA